MIEYIKIDNLKGNSSPNVETVVLKDDTPTHGLIIKNIDGLGQHAATINTKDFATADGSYVTSKRVGNKNLVLTFWLADSLNPDNQNDGTYNIENSRKRLYKLFQEKDKVKISVKTDTASSPNDFDYTDPANPTIAIPERWIEGIVEKAEPDIFSKEETVDVSLICNDPFFRISRRVAIGGEDSQSIYLNYYGTIEAGFVTRVKIWTIDVSMIHINGINIDVAKAISICPPNTFIAGNHIEVCTVPGKKYVELVVNYGGADEQRYDLIQACGAVPYEWRKLHYGTNQIVVTFGSSGPPTSGGQGYEWPPEDIYIIDEDGIVPKDTTNDILVVEYDELYGGI